MAEGNETAYVGKELDVFALAVNWKKYVKEEIGRYITGEVLEVGAGIGATTAALHDGGAQRWVCLEPDPILGARLRARLTQAECPATSVVVGSLRNFAKLPCFDCILYIDVLEHISDDRGEIEQAAALVRLGGHIVVLAPAHQWLFSEFDKSIGHVRRYERATLRSLMPAGWVEKKLSYLDSVGVLLSFANVLALRQTMPTASQITVWDRFCIPVSQRVDRLFGGRIGKSVLAVWANEQRP